MGQVTSLSSRCLEMEGVIQTWSLRLHEVQSYHPGDKRLSPAPVDKAHVLEASPMFQESQRPDAQQLPPSGLTAPSVRQRAHQAVLREAGSPVGLAQGPSTRWFPRSSAPGM